MSAGARRRIDLADVTGQIADTVEAIEAAHDDYAEAAADAAAAEADWKAAAAGTVVRIVNEGGKSSQDFREAAAMQEHETLYRTFMLSRARADVCRSGVRSLLARLDALRTAAADSRSLL